MADLFPPLSGLPGPPGEHPPPAPTPASYSDKIKVNLKRSERLKRNVLEISVESQGYFKLEEDDVAKLMTRLGIDLKTHAEGYQICPGNSRKIMIWLKDHVDITKFCKDESFRINENVRTGLIRPMDRKEVTVMIKNLNFNTPDSLVIDYLNKHGNVVSDKVIYEVKTEGPFKGLKNGVRRYNVDFTGGINLGSYHILDGASIEIRYPGQRRTCGRCHQSSPECKGNGIGKVCQEKGGAKAKLVDVMVEHWKKIGFCPGDFKLDDGLDDENDVEIKSTTSFTPEHRRKDMETPKEDTSKFTGVIIKNIPIALPNKDIIGMIHEAGAPETCVINVTKKDGGMKASAEVDDLTSDECLRIIEYLNEKNVHGNKVFCKGSSNLYTPKKNEANQSTDSSNSDEPNKSTNNSKSDEPEQSIDNTKSDESNDTIRDGRVSIEPSTSPSNPAAPASTIPGLPQQPPQTLSKSQLKKLRKQVKSKTINSSEVLVLDAKIQLHYSG